MSLEGQILIPEGGREGGVLIALSYTVKNSHDSGFSKQLSLPAKPFGSDGRRFLA
jgi:hypothetical protein